MQGWKVVVIDGKVTNTNTNRWRKWNSTKNTWGKDMCIRYAYQGKTMTTTYYKWNNKKGEYILVPEMTVIMDNPNM